MSDFTLALVAPSRDAANENDLGHETQVVELVTPSGDAAVDPTLTTPDVKDVDVDTAFGDDYKQHGRKRVTLDLQIDWIDAAVKEQIERLYWDGRDLYINPNYDRNTIFSYPLFRSLTQVAQPGGSFSNGTHVRSTPAYVWDEVDQVMRRYPANRPCFVFNTGRYSRALTTFDNHTNNHAAPIPVSFATGWSAFSGTITTNISRNRTPNLYQRTQSDPYTAIIHAERTGTTSVASAISSIVGLSGSYKIGCNMLIRGQGQVFIQVEDSAGTVTPLTGSTILTLGGSEWQHIQLVNNNASGGTTGVVSIGFTDTSTSTRDRSQSVEVALIGAYEIASSPTPQVMPWWHDGTLDSDVVSMTSTSVRIGAGVTFSWMTRWCEEQAGFFALGYGTSDDFNVYKDASGGSNPDNLVVVWSASSVSAARAFDMSAFGLSYGDICLFVVTVHENGLKLWCNGVAHPDNALNLRPDLPYEWGTDNRIGQTSSARYLDRSWICLLRADHGEVDDAWALKHYRTYGTKSGAACLNRLMGRKYVIDGMDFRERQVSGGAHQWIGTLSLREIALEEWAPVQAQEYS